VKGGKILDYFNFTFKTVVIAMVALMVFIVALGVFFRYVLNRPLFWSTEAAVVLLLWSVFLGSFYTYLEDSHVRMNFIVEKFGENGRRITLLVMDILSLIFLVIIFKDGLVLSIRMVGMRTPAIGLPIAVPMLSVPAGAILMAGVAVRHILVRISHLLENKFKQANGEEKRR